MESRFLVWSNEHRAWWRPNHCGYTGTISQAGRYDFAVACGICRNANAHLSPEQDPNEVLVLAPESIDATHLSRTPELQETSGGPKPPPDGWAP